MMAGNELRDLVDWERTIGAPELTSEMTHKMSELRHVLAAAHKGSPHWGGDVMVPLFADDSLHRYLRARGGDVKKAEKMIQKTLEWRLKEEPHLLRAKDFLDIENETGKCRSAGIDRWGRPILILDNTVENTTNVEAHMRLLFYTTERLIRRMKPPVEKQVIFVHLPDFSLWNTPPLKSSKTSLAVFSLYYAERLGHCIFWQPPSYFSTFIAMIRPFIDPATYAKVVVINGDASPGTVNDSKMNVLIGPDWRKKTGAGGTRQTPKSSPGYRHSEYWQGALQEDTAIAAAEANPTAAQNETCPAARGSSMSTNEGLTNHTANTNKDYNSHSQFFRAVKEADMVRIDQVASTTSTIHPATCTNYDGCTALHIAAREGHVKVVKFLLDLSCDCGAQTKRGGTALMGAVVAGHTDVVELLLSHGATVDASDKVGYTPLILATIHDQAAVLEQLIIAGANYEQTDNDGYTALLRAVQFGRRLCVDKLLAAGASKDATNRDGVSAKRIAEKERRGAIAALL